MGDELTTADRARRDVKVLHWALVLLSLPYWLSLALLHAVCTAFAIGSIWGAVPLQWLHDKVISRYVRWRPTGVPDRSYIFPAAHRGGVVSSDDVPQLPDRPGEQFITPAQAAVLRTADGGWPYKDAACAYSGPRPDDVDTKTLASCKLRFAGVPPPPFGGFPPAPDLKISVRWGEPGGISAEASRELEHRIRAEMRLSGRAR